MKKIILTEIKPAIIKWFADHLDFGKLSAETLGWLAPVVIHCATIPTLLALLTGLSDRTPSVEIILFVWAGLVLLFGRAIILKDTFNIVTIGSGFIAQAVIMALILFK